MQEHIDRVLAGLQSTEDAIHESRVRRGVESLPADQWTAKPRRKYTALDVGSSGVFLVDNATGELYNITAYGVPDLNKKRKANLGNITTVDPTVLHSRRWNHLR